jgi:hypothetical protein
MIPQRSSLGIKFEESTKIARAGSFPRLGRIETITALPCFKISEFAVIFFGLVDGSNPPLTFSRRFPPNLNSHFLEFESPNKYWDQWDV